MAAAFATDARIQKTNKLLELSLPSETVKKMNVDVSWFISANELSGINTKTDLEHSVTF